MYVPGILPAAEWGFGSVDVLAPVKVAPNQHAITSVTVAIVDPSGRSPMKPVVEYRQIKVGFFEISRIRTADE